MKLIIKKCIYFFILIYLFLTFNFSFCYAASNEPDILAESAILMESSTEKILYSKNFDKKMYPASTTKILTAILTIENCNLNDIVTVPYDAIMSIPSGYSVASLQAGEKLTVEQLLQVMLIHSANDAANVLAYHVSGDIPSFANLMNNKVEELGLKNTHFTNPSGKHDNNHYTTAYDLAIIMKYCMKNPTFRNLSKLKYCSIPETNKYEERVFNTTNELLIYDNRNVDSNYYYPYAIAGKTGYTSEANNCLVSVSNKDGFELINVILSVGLYPNNLSGKFIDTKALFNYGYDNFAIKKLRDSNAIATQIEIPKASKETKMLDLLIENEISAIVNQNNLNTDFTPEIKIIEDISAPISQGQIVGKITYTIDDIEYSSNLIASHSVEKSTFLYLVIRIILIFSILLLLYKILFSDNSKKSNYKKYHKNNRI